MDLLNMDLLNAQTIEAISAVVLTVVGVAAAWFSKKYVDRHGSRQIVYDAASAAVAETYETFVRTLKEKAADGKLTPEERREAFNISLGRMKQIARDRGVDIAKEHGEEIARAVLQQVVLVAKTRAARPPTA